MEDTDEMEETDKMEDTEETEKTKDVDESSDTMESPAVQQRLPYSEEKPTSERGETEAEEVEYLLDFPISWAQNYAAAPELIQPQSREEQNQSPQVQNQSPQVQNQSPQVQSNLTQSQVLVHSNPNYPLQGFFKCSRCEEVFRTEGELKNHNKKPHKYTLSEKKFLTSYTKNHQVCHICFREKHTRLKSCPVILLYNANVSARMPNHICITCLSRRTPSCPEKCGWDKVTKRPKFCRRHAGRIKIHRDICRKCHQKKRVAGLQQSSDINTSAGKSTGTTTSTGTFVGTSRNTVKSTCKITQGSSRSIRTSMGNTSNRENRTKLDCKKLEEKIKEAMMETLQNS